MHLNSLSIHSDTTGLIVNTSWGYMMDVGNENGWRELAHGLVNKYAL